MKNQETLTIDGNQAAATVAHKLNEEIQQEEQVFYFQLLDIQVEKDYFILNLYLLHQLIIM
ncbi:MAG: hypothetical protein PHY54_18320, partial [Methylococcales bacterium]|nr:hypothetical protein [Methylococcales bacterium]